MANQKQLVITINERGEFSVTGPIDDKLTCYALLEAARDEIHAHCDKKKNLLQPTGDDMLQLARR